MNTITYVFLTEKNFNEDSLDDFLRHQEVKECWGKNSNNEYVLVANEYTEDWDLNKRKKADKKFCIKLQEMSHMMCKWSMFYKMWGFWVYCLV